MQTYADLKKTLLDYIDYYDEELEVKLDFFIDNAEREVARILRVPYNEKLIKLPFANSDERDVVNIPNDYLESKDLFIQETSEVFLMATFNTIMQLKRDSSNDCPTNHYYTRMGNQFILYPELKDNETLLFNYYADPVNMRKGADTSYILTNSPALLLFLAMKHALVFLKNDEDAAKYNALAQNEIEQIRAQVNSMDVKPKQIVVRRRSYK